MDDPSPLIRAAASEGLQAGTGKEAIQALTKATGDSHRLVRIRAAASLAGRRIALQDSEAKQVESATKEHLESIRTRPDQWDSHYNLGNYYLTRGEIDQAVEAYEKAVKKEPRAVVALVNQAMAYARMGENQKAGGSLKRALAITPDDAAANFNMGLLKAEENDLPAAEKYLRAAFKADPQLVQAAYNLSVILARDRPDEAVDFCKKAVEIRPDDPRYSYTLAFLLLKKGDLSGAATLLDSLLSKHPLYGDNYVLLGGIFEKQGKLEQAKNVYQSGLAVQGIPDHTRVLMNARLQALSSPAGATEKK